jgi:hypothetical protein
MEILNHEWRWKHNYFIRSEAGIVKIRQRKDQLEMSELLYRAFFNRERLDLIILKNRQRGTSTWCSLFCLDCTAYYPGKVADTLADTQPRASSIFDNVAKLAWDRIPDGLKPKADKDNKTALDFSASVGSKYIISATKSEPADILHISEAPYFPDEGKITEAEQMLRGHGIEIMESTAYGVGNLFEKRFTEAWQAQEAGKYHHRRALFFPWYTDPTNIVTVHPDMALRNAAFIETLTRTIHEKDGIVLTPEQQFFYDQKMTDLDEEVFQFYPSEPEEAFLHSGRPVFNQEMLKALRKHCRPPLRVTDDGIEIYEEPDPKKHYGIGVDTAEGLADGDNSVISVVCKETGEEVAQAAGKISAIDEDSLAHTIRNVALLYRNHLCVIERNNHGHTVIAFVKAYSEVNLYQRQVKDRITEKTETVIGWNTDPKSKAYVIDTLKSDLKNGQCIPHSFETHDELRVFVHGERGTMAAMKGHHDDRVIAFSLANLACHELIILGSLNSSSYGFY